MKTAQRPNPKAKARQLAEDWEAMMRKHSKPLDCGAKARGIKVVTVKTTPKIDTTIRKTQQPKSLMTVGGSTAKVEPKMYTGTKIIGIATMHKSNMVPIFNEEAAIEVAQMRRN